MVDRTKPYRNELVISILRDYIFSGRHSLASKFSNRFESSIDTDEDNVEIPISMLALVGTAVRRTFIFRLFLLDHSLIPL